MSKMRENPGVMKSDLINICIGQKVCVTIEVCESKNFGGLRPSYTLARATWWLPHQLASSKSRWNKVTQKRIRT